METFDAIVVGGGIIGGAIACELSRQRLRVIVIDRQTPGREASWAAAGMLSPSPDPSDSKDLSPIAKTSYQLYPGFLAWIENLSGLSADYRRDGALHTFTSASGEAERDALVAEHRKLGLATRAISIEDARSIEPLLNADILAAAFVADEASLDPRKLTASVFGAAQRLGVDVRTGALVTSLLIDKNCCKGVMVDHSQIWAKYTVIAAGCFSALIDSVAVYAPTRPIRGQMVALRLPGATLKCVLRSDDGYLVPRHDGRIIAGSTLEDVGYNKAVTPRSLMKILGAALALAPSLAHADIVESWSGLRPGTPDGLPVLGKTDKDGLLIATGHYRNGILLAPVTARLIMECVMKLDHNLEMSKFSPLRFANRPTPNAIL